MSEKKLVHLRTNRRGYKYMRTAHILYFDIEGSSDVCLQLDKKMCVPSVRGRNCVAHKHTSVILQLYELRRHTSESPRTQGTQDVFSLELRPEGTQNFGLELRAHKISASCRTEGTQNFGLVLRAHKISASY